MKNAPTANAGTTSLFNSMLKNLGIKNNNATNGIMKVNASLITDDLDFINNATLSMPELIFVYLNR